MSQFVMATHYPLEGESEAEPIFIDVESGRLTLILDDGERIVVQANEFIAALDLEMAADELQRRAA